MASILEYTLTLNDKISGKLKQIGIESNKLSEVFDKVEASIEKIAIGDEINSLISNIASLSPIASNILGPIDLWDEAFAKVDRFQERVDELYSQLKVAISPITDWMAHCLDGILSWIESNKEPILAVVNTVAQVFSVAFQAVEFVVKGVISVFDWWFEKLGISEAVLPVITTLIGAFAAIILTAMVVTKAMALWDGLVSAGKLVWAVAQTVLNAALWACPLTWIIAGIIALIAVIAYVCYKVDGWGTLWEGIVGFMKYSFLAFVAGIELSFSSMVNNFMNGLDTLVRAYYKLKQTLGIGDSNENQAAIDQLDANIQKRKDAIEAAKNKVDENERKAKESLQKINLKWDDSKSLSDITSGLQKALGLTPAPSAPATVDFNPKTGTSKTPGAVGDEGMTSDAVSSIATGGSRSSNITINLTDLVGQVIFQGGYESEADQMEQDLASRLVQVLQMAKTAQ